jgi:hypothetical protein
MSALAAQWLTNPWLCWGVGPLLATNLGYWVPAAVLETLLATGWCDSSAITYASTKAATRKQLLQETQQRIPFAKQVYGSFLVLLGPRGLLNSLVMALVGQLVRMDRSSWLPATAAACVAQFLALLVLADFGLYWGEHSRESSSSNICYHHHQQQRRRHEHQHHQQQPYSSFCHTPHTPGLLHCIRCSLCSHGTWVVAQAAGWLVCMLQVPHHLQQTHLPSVAGNPLVFEPPPLVCLCL